MGGTIREKINLPDRPIEAFPWSRWADQPG
jgi:hypothetical protein